MSDFATKGIAVDPVLEDEWELAVPGAGVGEVIARLEQLGLWGAASESVVLPGGGVLAFVAGDETSIWRRRHDTITAHRPDELLALLRRQWPAAVIGPEADQLTADVPSTLRWMAVGGSIRRPAKLPKGGATSSIVASTIDGRDVVACVDGDPMWLGRAGRRITAQIAPMSVALWYSPETGFFSIDVQRKRLFVAGHDWDQPWRVFGGADPHEWSSARVGDADEIGRSLDLGDTEIRALRNQMTTTSAADADTVDAVVRALALPPDVSRVLCGRLAPTSLPDARPYVGRKSWFR